jgi:hypothetical protein
MNIVILETIIPAWTWNVVIHLSDCLLSSSTRCNEQGQMHTFVGFPEQEQHELWLCAIIQFTEHGSDL